MMKRLALGILAIGMLATPALADDIDIHELDSRESRNHKYNKEERKDLKDLIAKEKKKSIADYGKNWDRIIKLRKDSKERHKDIDEQIEHQRDASKNRDDVLGGRIKKNKKKIKKNKEHIEVNQEDISENSGKIGKNKRKIKKNKKNIAHNKKYMEENWEYIQDNQDDIADNHDGIDDNYDEIREQKGKSKARDEALGVRIDDEKTASIARDNALGGRIDENKAAISENREAIEDAIALSVAIPDAYLSPGKNFSLALGGGFTDGSSAFGGIGTFRFTENFTVYGGGSALTGGGTWAAKGGGRFEW